MGASEMLGIYLPENFRSAFFSQSIGEFWRRWHITLGLWFKEYLLYPLLKSNLFILIGSWSRKTFGKKKGKSIPAYLGLPFVWIGLGIWHGGTPVYMMASGILPCIYLLGSELLQPFFKSLVLKLRINTNCLSYRVFCRIRTFALMCGCWFFVASGSVHRAWYVFRNMLNFNIQALFDQSLFTLGLDQQGNLLVLLGLLIVTAVDYCNLKGICVRKALAKQNIIARYLVLWAGVLVVMQYAVFGGSQFIYFQF